MNLVHNYHRLKRLPLSALPRFAAFKTAKLFHEKTERFSYSYSRPYVPRKKIAVYLLTPLNVLHPDVLTAGFGDMFREEFSSDADEIIADADRAVSSTFDLLGSGPVDLKQLSRKNLYWVPRDGNGSEPERAEVKGNIPWNFDFKSGYGWNPTEFFTDIGHSYYPGSDIKVPWELSRCRHFVALGQAYRITAHEKYAKAFFEQMEDWIQNNAFKFGVNWVCPMDVALRACNWLLAWEFFSKSPSRTKFFEDNFAGSLYEHGAHIRRHLEWGAEVSSNHYLSDLAGLAYIGHAVGQKEWMVFSKSEMEKEILRQVLPDGFDYETSTGYHRLVLELFFYAALLFERQKDESMRFSSEAKSRLHRMFSVVNRIASDAGEMPLIGDNDSGRVHVFKERPDADIRYLSNFGALFFRDGRLKIEEWGFVSESAWLFGFSGRETHKSMSGLKTSEIPSKSAESSGLAALRHNGVVVFSAQPNGTSGVGGHTHNDKLSFTFSAGKDFFLSDPGNYLYTSDPEKRNLFRSTRMHTTVEIDGEEQNRFDPRSLFSLHEDSRITVEKDNAGKEIAASHSGYRRLSDPVDHKRTIRIEGDKWIVEDEFSGKTEHDLKWSFVCHPKTKPKAAESGSFTIEGSTASLHVACSEKLEFKVEDGAFAPGYGVHVPTSIVRAAWRVRLPVKVIFSLTVVQ